MTRAVAWISAIFLPLGLIPLGWMTMLAVGFCDFDCGAKGTLAINALIAACVLIAIVWLVLLVAMIRRRVVRWIAILAGIADILLLGLLAFTAWSFGGV